MGQKTFRKKSERRKDSRDRKSRRYAVQGRMMEKWVIGILAKKQAEKEIESFEYSRPFSEEDLAGIDFTIRKRVTGVISVRKVQVTISKRSYQEHIMKNPDIPCILLTFEMREERFWERINWLFADYAPKGV